MQKREILALFQRPKAVPKPARSSISASRVPVALRAFQRPRAVPNSSRWFHLPFARSRGQGPFQIVPSGSKSPAGGPKESGEEGKKKKGCHLDIPIFT